MKPVKSLKLLMILMNVLGSILEGLICRYLFLTVIL